MAPPAAPETDVIVTGAESTTAAPVATVPAVARSKEGVKLCLRGLPSTHAVEKDEILAFFGDEASNIPFVWVARNPPGFAFVRYNGSEDAVAFAARFNEKTLNDVPVLVSIEAPPREEKGVKLIVRGLPTDRPVEAQDISDFFGECAKEIENVWVARNPPGFAFVRYMGAENAVDFAARFDGKTLANGPVQVNVSSQPEKRNRDAGGRGGGRGGGGRGGGRGGFDFAPRGGFGSGRFDDRRGGAPSGGYRRDDRGYDDRRYDDRRYDDRRDDRRYDDRRYDDRRESRRDDRRYDDRR